MKLKDLFEATNKNPEWFLKEKHLIERKLDMHIGKHLYLKVLKNLHVKCQDDSEAIELKLNNLVQLGNKYYLPCQFDNSGRYFSVIDSKDIEIGSLVGLPTSHKSLYIEAKKINFDFFPNYIEGVSFYSTLSLEGIGKNKSYINQWLRADDAKSHVLGLLNFGYGPNALIQVGDNRELGSILTKHAKGDRDINDCQEELIEAGYKDYAKL